MVKLGLDRTWTEFWLRRGTEQLNTSHNVIVLSRDRYRSTPWVDRSRTLCRNSTSLVCLSRWIESAKVSVLIESKAGLLQRRMVVYSSHLFFEYATLQVAFILFLISNNFWTFFAVTTAMRNSRGAAFPHRVRMGGLIATVDDFTLLFRVLSNLTLWLRPQHRNRTSLSTPNWLVLPSSPSAPAKTLLYPSTAMFESRKCVCTRLLLL